MDKSLFLTMEAIGNIIFTWFLAPYAARIKIGEQLFENLLCWWIYETIIYKLKVGKWWLKAVIVICF